MRSAYRLPLHVRIARPIIRTCFRGLFLALSRIEITGEENIPFGRPYIVAMNHVSLYDPPFIVAFWPETLEVMGAQVVWERAGQKQLVSMYGVIPVHRGDYDRRLIARVLAALRAGRPLLIAPEGGRSHVTAMRRAKPGVAYLLDKARVPVVPVGLVGTTNDFWQRARRGERPQLEMHIGAPIQLPPIEAKGAERRAARQRNADLVMSHIAGLLPEEYRGVYAESAVFPTTRTSR